MSIPDQVFWLLVIAAAVASVAWTITQEEIFREPREYFAEHSKHATSFLFRKFCYMMTCEYCFSHWVTIFFLFITGFRLIFDDWRGYLLSFFVTAWTANQIMSLYRRLRVVIKLDNAIAEKELDES
ncbi:MAG: hypothetical protein PSX80_07825 [bacterium]|nr:hypothetical protein [bacterium]